MVVFCFFAFGLGNGPVDVKVSSDFFSLGRIIAVQSCGLGHRPKRLDVLILYIKVSWFLKTDGCHFGISYWYPILELIVIFASKVRNP